MTTWTFFLSETGAPMGRTYSGPADGLGANTPPGAVAVPGVYDIADGCLVGGEFAPYTDAERARYAARPGAGWAWDVSTRAWVDARTLDAARAEAWARIKAARAAAIGGGMTHAGALYDTDEASRANIAGAAQGAAYALITGAVYVRAWTLADNTVVTLDGAQILALGVALDLHVDAAHATARALRAQINDATTNAACDAIAWPAA